MMSNRLRRQRIDARRSLLSFALGVAILNVGLLIACEVAPRLRDPIFGDKQHKLMRRWDGRSPLVLMLGTSRTGYGFHAAKVEALIPGTTAFNFGVPASGPVTHLLYLRRLLDEGVVPNVLLVEVLPSMFADHGLNFPMEANWLRGDRLRTDEVDFVGRYGLSYAKYAPACHATFINPWYALRFQLLARVAVGWVPWNVRYDWGRGGDGAGWITPVAQNVTPDSYQRGLLQAQSEYAAILQYLTLGGPAADAMRDILRLARERSIPVKLVWMPEGKDFRAMYPSATLERIDAFFRTLDVEVIDARRWVDEGKFTDSHHLIRSGAEQFTEKLAREWIAPMLQGGR